MYNIKREDFQVTGYLPLINKKGKINVCINGKDYFSNVYLVGGKLYYEIKSNELLEEFALPYNKDKKEKYQYVVKNLILVCE